MKWFLLFLAMGEIASAVSENFQADLKVFFLIDTEAHFMGDDISAACVTNRDLLHQTLQRAAKQEGKSYQAWAQQGRNLNASTTQAFLRKLPVKKTDTLLVYYCGHGVMEPGNRHVFQTSGGEIPRSLIQQELNASVAKHTILMTDTCSARIGGRSMRPQDSLTESPQAEDILSDLLFRSTGRVDITAANPPELAWFFVTGGIFTQSFLETVSADRQGLDLNHDGRVSWREIYVPLAVAMDTSFRTQKATLPAGHKIHAQRTQTPAVWTITD